MNLLRFVLALNALSAHDALTCAHYQQTLSSGGVIGGLMENEPPVTHTCADGETACVTMSMEFSSASAGISMRAQTAGCGVATIQCAVVNAMGDTPEPLSALQELSGNDEAVDTAPPTTDPTASPTALPSSSPTKAPTASPTALPSSSPTKAPTAPPIGLPSSSPTKAPTASPTALPSSSPTKAPTASPTYACAGYSFQGGCWFASNPGVTCSTTCAGAGLTCASMLIDDSTCELCKHWLPEASVCGIYESSNFMPGYNANGVCHTTSINNYASQCEASTFSDYSQVCNCQPEGASRALLHAPRFLQDGGAPADLKLDSIDCSEQKTSVSLEQAQRQYDRFATSSATHVDDRAINGGNEASIHLTFVSLLLLLVGALVTEL